MLHVPTAALWPHLEYVADEFTEEEEERDSAFNHRALYMTHLPSAHIPVISI